MKPSAIALACALSMTSTHAADNAMLVKFARANVGAYPQEIATQRGPKLGEAFTITATEHYAFDSNYDAQAETVRIETSSTHFFLDSRCRNAGSFDGQNGFGARTAVRRQECSGVRIDVGHIPLRAELPRVEPRLFRVYRDIGFKVEIDLELIANETGKVASFERSVDRATVSNPVQTENSIFTLSGKVREVRLLMTGRPPAVLYAR
jgi:hypothetical protein